MRYLPIVVLAAAIMAATFAPRSTSLSVPPPMLGATEVVTPDAFWALIEAARSNGADCDSQAATLDAQLSQLSPEQIVQFDQEMRARLVESYRWDLWGVAYLINGGASDDGFEYFRAWLIAQGRDYFSAALGDPERAADRAEAGEAECEAMLYVAADAYESKTGEQLPPSGVRYPAKPAGQPPDEEDLEARFPAVARRFN
ncbi:MAG TPA: DUF4240 domain-containing protein [Longimicrobium sp.]|nr:DUF4240 domain-containing protein [Longimicrobium sp.]